MNFNRKFFSYILETNKVKNYGNTDDISLIRQPLPYITVSGQLTKILWKERVLSLACC